MEVDLQNNYIEKSCDAEKIEHRSHHVSACTMYICGMFAIKFYSFSHLSRASFIAHDRTYPFARRLANRCAYTILTLERSRREQCIHARPNNTTSLAYYCLGNR